MVGMNSQIHLSIDSDSLGSLRIEAERLQISVGELIRRKLANPPTDEEILRLRELEKLIIERRKK